jgi:hypothetical protein
MAFKLRLKQGLSTKQRLVIVGGGASLLALIAYFTITINTADIQDSTAAHRDLLVSDPVSNGEVILGFTWDENQPKKPDIGSEAQDISIHAECIPGGVDSSFGLSAGNTMKDINLKLKSDDNLNGDGIDISVDFRRMEESGNFYTRGTSFNFGMQKGKIAINYKLTSINGKSYSIAELTNYDIPEDQQFRNYRFIYNPNTGKGEILVNNATIWTNQGIEKSRLTWKTDEAILIGQGMNGSGKAIAIFDNLVIRKTGTTNKAPMDLLSFSADLQGSQVVISWNTAKEDGTDYFKIERSTDTKNFEEIGRVKAAVKSITLKSYQLIDKSAQTGVSYYRLGLSNNSAKSVWMPVIAFRLKPEMLSSSPSVGTSAVLDPVQK